MGKYKRYSLLTFIQLVILLVAISVFFSCSSKEEPPPQIQENPKKSEQDEIYRQYNIERGKRLVELGGCSMCHTPKIKTAMGYRPDKDRFLSGYPEDKDLPNLPYAEVVAGESDRSFYTTDATIWVGRWGVSFAPNLTPDPETGIGAWTEDDFINVFRGNQHFPEGQEIVTPMPINVYSQLSFFELRSIYIYLQTIEPISNEVPTRIYPESDIFEEGEDL